MTAPRTDERNEDGRYVCTKEHPWTPDKGHAIRPDAVDDGGCYEGCCDDYRCPNCGTKWRTEHSA